MPIVGTRDNDVRVTARETTRGLGIGLGIGRATALYAQTASAMSETTATVQAATSMTPSFRGRDERRHSPRRETDGCPSVVFR